MSVNDHIVQAYNPLHQNYSLLKTVTGPGVKGLVQNKKSVVTKLYSREIVWFFFEKYTVIPCGIFDNEHDIVCAFFLPGLGLEFE